MAKKTTPAKEPTTNKQNEGSIDQVRELLFGEQARRLEQRFARLEQRLDEAFGELEDRLQSASREHGEDSSKLRGEVRDLRQDAENRMAAIEDECNAQLRDVDKQLRGELKNLYGKLQTTAAQLDDDKTGRAQLAELLNNLAAQLVQDSDR